MKKHLRQDLFIASSIAISSCPSIQIVSNPKLEDLSLMIQDAKHRRLILSPESRADPQ